MRPPAVWKWRFLVHLALSLGVIWLVVAQFDAEQVWLAFARLQAVYLIPIVLVLTPLAVVLRSLRWRCLVPGGEEIPLRSYIGAYVVGLLANSLLLGRLGDAVKAKLICRAQMSYAKSLATVVIDRILEGVALLLVFAGVLLSADLPAWINRIGWIGGATGLAFLLGLRWLFVHRKQFLRLLERGLERFPQRMRLPVLRTAGSMLAGIEALTDYRRTLLATAYGLAVWSVELLAVSAFLAAFSIEVPRLTASLVILVVLNFGMLVPITPGSVGVYQLLCVYALAIWGVDEQLAFSLGITMQAVLFIPVYVAGTAWLVATPFMSEKAAA